MLTTIFRRFKSDSSAIGNDLNKKILEAFNSIIDKGTKSTAARKEPTVEPIARYNVDSRNTVVKIQDYKSKISAISDNDAILVRNSPDIFKRNKMSPQFLHKDVYLLSKMLSPSGSILSKALTSNLTYHRNFYYFNFAFKQELTSKTHRHMSKAIRRARQMGILPYMYRPKVNAIPFINAHVDIIMYSEPEWSQATTKSGFLEIMKAGKIIGTFPIPCGTKFITFGRLPENNVPLDHESISRKHAVLQFGPGDSAFIYDHGSSHGTFVNKKQIPECQYVKITSGNAIIRFGASSRYFVMNLEEKTTNLPLTHVKFRTVVLSFFLEHGISLKAIEFIKLDNLFSCSLDFSDYISIDLSETPRITASGATKEEAFENFYEDSYNFLSRLGLINEIKNDLDSASDSDVTNEDFYNYDHLTSNDSKASKKLLTENEILSLLNTAKSKIVSVQSEIAGLLCQLEALESEVLEDFDVFVQTLKKDEVKKDIEKRESMVETMKNELSKYQSILTAIGYKETPEEIDVENTLLTESKLESKFFDKSNSLIKKKSKSYVEILTTDSKRNKITNDYIKNVACLENENSDLIEEQVDFEDSTLHDEPIDLGDLKRKYRY